MKVYKFSSPYKPNGRTTFPETVDRSGVYIIKENNKIVYVGMSLSNLYKTMYRHFEKWNHRTQEVVSYQTRLQSNKYTVRVILCTKLQAQRLERALILKYMPRDNEVKYKGYQLTFADNNLVENYQETKPEEVPF